jgi:hypothetical protein
VVLSGAGQLIAELLGSGHEAHLLLQAVLQSKVSGLRIVEMAGVLCFIGTHDRQRLCRR